MNKLENICVWKDAMYRDNAVRKIEHKTEYHSQCEKCKGYNLNCKYYLRDTEFDK